MKALRINQKITNKTVKNEINKFKKELKKSELTENEIKILVDINYLNNPKFRFRKIKNNFWFDRFTKTYNKYTQSKREKNKSTDIRNVWLRMLKKKQIKKIMLNKDITESEAELEYIKLTKKLSLKSIINTFGS